MQPVLPCPFNLKGLEKSNKTENCILSIQLKFPRWVRLLCLRIAAAPVKRYRVPTGEKYCVYWRKKRLFYRHKRREKERYQQTLCCAFE